MNDQQQELLKLDDIDRKVLLWLMVHSPEAICNWLEYMAVVYRHPTPQKPMSRNCIRRYSEKGG